MKKLHLIIYSLLTVLAVHNVALSQEIGRIEGSVTDKNHTPLVGVSLVLEGTTQVVKTDKNGVFLFNDLQPNTYTIIASSANHETKKQTVSLGANDTQNIDIVLVETLYQLPETKLTSAAEELKQAPGASIILAEDLAARPVTNDLSEYIRTQPGINLTGNTATGQRGNNRQIDIRGMGPENTLILIDGIPVMSRNSVKMGRSGERDTRGDANWVPAEAIERIEVLRGPAAARYGSGSSGGVVNIITKKPQEQTVTVSYYAQVPQSEKEGSSWRANVLASGPLLNDKLSYRAMFSYNRTDADSPDINADHAVTVVSRGNEAQSVAAGREGVENRDFRGLIEYRPDESNIWGVEVSYSRQGNIYAGDAQFQTIDRVSEDLIGTETNIVKRSTFVVNHKGNYEFGTSFSYFGWEKTENTRLGEGGAGGGEGLINSDEFFTIDLDNYSGKSEWNLYSSLFGFNQVITLGVEYRGERMNDAVSNQIAINVPEDTVLPGGTDLDPEDRDPDSGTDMVAFYLEDNIPFGDLVTLTPGLRADWHSTAGVNLSPSLNGSLEITPNLTFKAGISRAFKAPNLYQLNPDYVYTTRGNGCPYLYPSMGSGCSILGNEDLEHETSLNKELGIAYNNDSDFNVGLTYFHNDYKHRISASIIPDLVVGTTQIFHWENTPEAVVEGLEGNLVVPLLATVTWSTNATMILESEDKETGQPLSLVPDYTINSSLDWQVFESLRVILSATHYGETPSPRVSVRGEPISNPIPVDPYTMYNLNVAYHFENGLQLALGVKNLFDKGIFRQGTGNNAGANTYNEAGRTYQVGFSKSF